MTTVDKIDSNYATLSRGGWKMFSPVAVALRCCTNPIIGNHSFKCFNDFGNEKKLSVALPWAEENLTFIMNMHQLFQSSSIMASVAILLMLFQVSHAKISAIAVFRRDEVDLHKYSAVLAAIEPFRLQLSDEIKKSINPLSYAFHKMKGNYWTNCCFIWSRLYLCICPFFEIVRMMLK